MFKRMMDSLLHGLRKFTAAYLDDIVIFSTSWEEHLFPPENSPAMSAGGKTHNKALQVSVRHELMHLPRPCCWKQRRMPRGSRSTRC